MRPESTDRPDAVTALLAELSSVDPAEAAALREVLDAASAPAAPGELRGEAAAVAAFRSARRPLDRRSKRIVINQLARLAGIKAAAVALALTTTGGVALAATSGALPLPIRLPGTHPAGTDRTGTPAPTASGHAGEHNRGTPGRRPTDTGTGAEDTAAAGPAQWTGLCAAVTHGNALHNPGKAARSTAFSRLITAAGGVDRVPTFCAGVLDPTPAATGDPAAGPPDRAGDDRSAQPGRSGQPHGEAHQPHGNNQHNGNGDASGDGT
jgi:hypothetical protein